MTAYAGTTAVYEGLPNLGVKEIFVTAQDDADATDTIDVTLTDYGIHPLGLLTVEGWTHTTNNSAMINAPPITTSVTSGVLTITIPAGSDNDARVYKIVGLATQPDLTSA